MFSVGRTGYVVMEMFDILLFLKRKISCKRKIQKFFLLKIRLSFDYNFNFVGTFKITLILYFHSRRSLQPLRHANKKLFKED